MTRIVSLVRRMVLLLGVLFPVALCCTHTQKNLEKSSMLVDQEIAPADSMTDAFGYPTNRALFEGKNILIMGGTGFLGRGVIAEVLKYRPQRITVFSRDEVKHFNVARMFGNNPTLHFVLGDIRDYQSVLAVTRGMDIVFHVGALKRMDLLEFNPLEAVKTNILGSLNIFNACVANNVPRVLYISTDKACSPVNIYGACKFVGEKIFNNYDRSRIQTKFITTRFGNILESTGSVIPFFVEKIKNGEEIPLTHENMTRFIINQKQASELICDALRYGDGGEIFVKRLPALRVVDLIDVLKEKFNGTNSVKNIGLRPGEKLHESLLNMQEFERTIEFNGFFIVRPSVSYSTGGAVPVYMKLGKPADTSVMKEYSSDLAVLSRDELAQLFEETLVLRTLGLLDEE